MLNQHQFWVTKKTVQRKLGSKEDQCVVSSDTELDLKLGLFASISATTHSIYRVLDLYQERVSLLALEETQLGQFLREHGKLNKSSGGGGCGKRMSTAGKAISYSGQQRMALRSPLVRLHGEVETFRSRAVADTQATLSAMERDRTEYRAALSWMKSITLDPDDDRALEKFRKAQQTVRWSKEKFERKSLDCLEKIDLLAAARCNMFSHVLVAYQKAMETFAHKTYETLKVASKILENEPHYAFSVLRDLTQAEKEPKPAEQQTEATVPEMTENAIDADQLLFFQDEYTDSSASEAKITETQQLKPPTATAILETTNESESLIAVGEETGNSRATKQESSSILSGLDEQDAFLLSGDSASGALDGDLLNMDFGFLESDNSTAAEGASANQIDPLLDLLGQEDNPNGSPQQSLAPAGGAGSSGKSMFSALTNKLKTNKVGEAQNGPASNKSKTGGKDMSSWFKLFSELDPLANPDAMCKQIEGNNSHSA